jgi:hypothetical protein
VSKFIVKAIVMLMLGVVTRISNLDGGKEKLGTQKVSSHHA